MVKLKDIIKKDKETVILYTGMFFTVSGLVTDLYLSKHSEYQNKKSEKMEVSAPVQTANEEELKVCDYSMKVAFQLGLINSIGEYVDEVPYKRDTVTLSLDNMDDIRKGYYTKITNGDSVESYITISHIDVDTNGLPEPMKGLCLSFAERSNDPIAEKGVRAHEVTHIQEVDFNLTAASRGIYSSAEEVMGRFNTFACLREEFKKNNDPKIFKSSDYRFYYYALKRGDVDPFSQDSLEQRKEQLFVLSNLFEQFNQTLGETYDDELINAIKGEPEYDHTHPDELKRALDKLFTTIWDGKLVNINPISTGELEAPILPPKTQKLINCLTAKEEYRKSIETPKITKEPDINNQVMQKGTNRNY